MVRGETRAHVLLGSASLQGPGLHTGQELHLRIEPAPVGHGLQFYRTDLPGHSPLPAGIASVHFERQCTGLRRQGSTILTIEHLLAALGGLGVWDAMIFIDGPEVPILDGSAAPLVSALQEAGLDPLPSKGPFLRILKRVKVEREDRWICFEPADGFEVDCFLEFDHPLLRGQRYHFVEGRDSFVRDLAPARTFGFLKDVESLRNSGLARGGSLDNAVVIGERSVVNEEGLRFPDEFARHKALDILGDLALLGMPVVGRVCAHKSGHALHHALLRSLMDDPASFRVEGAEPSVSLHRELSALDRENRSG